MSWSKTAPTPAQWDQWFWWRESEGHCGVPRYIDLTGEIEENMRYYKAADFFGEWHPEPIKEPT